MKIKTEILGVFRSLHTWVGISAGLFLFLGFYAGSITVFREDIAQWQTGSHQELTDDILDQVPEFVEKVVSANPAAERGVMVILPGGHETHLLAQWRTREGVKYASETDSGEISYKEPSSRQVSQFIDQLHRSAGIPEPFGELIMGVAAMLYALALISGTIIFLPSLSKNIFAFRIGKNLKRLWMDVHNGIGMISLPFHIMFAVTAVVMTLHDPIFLVMNKVIYPDNGSQLMMKTIMPATLPAKTEKKIIMKPAESLISSIQDDFPDFKPSTLMFSHPGKEGAVITVMGDLPHYLAHRSRFIFNGETGALIGSERPGNRPQGMAILSGSVALHSGDYGGRLVQWLYFILGMLGTLLFYSGNVLWLKKHEKKHLGNRSLALKAFSALTPGVCLGIPIGVSLILFVCRVDAFMQQTAISYTNVFWAAVVLSIFYSAFRGHRKATRDLLVIVSIVTGLVFVESIFIHRSQGVWTGVDACVLIMAIIFFLLYLRSKKLCLSD